MKTGAAGYKIKYFHRSASAIINHMVADERLEVHLVLKKASQ
jgi:hypothetical protein